MRKKKETMILAVSAIIVSFAISLDARLPATGLVREETPILAEEYVPMRDGVRLYTRIFLPDPDIWGPGPFPAIVMRTPYGIGEPGVPPEQWPYWPHYGYVLVAQDTRGRFSSEGLDRFFYDDGPDGYDTIEWVASQTWCTGKVGQTGTSAMGITAYLAAGEKPPHLVAILSAASSANAYNDYFYEGQAATLETVLPWIAGQIGGLSESHISSLGLSPEELGVLGTQWAVINNDLKSHLGLEYPDRPVDSDWWMYLPLLDYPALSVLHPFAWNETLLHSDQDDFRDCMNVKDTIEVPVLHLAGWYDMFSRGSLEAFIEIQNRIGNQKLIMTNATHDTIWSEAPYYPEILWFDYWLKNTNTGIMDEPPVSYYCMGADEWQYADQWPPPGIKYTTYYLHSDGVLSTDSPMVGEAPTSYVYDPRNPVLTEGGRNMVVPSGSFDQRPCEPPYRNDVLVYTSEVLEQDVEITGPIEVVLRVSSNCTDTDFTAKLIDVHPDGSAMLILDGVIRARYRESTRYGVPMDAGTIYTLTIDVGDTSQVFKAGHRIQVDISSSNFPRRSRNTNTGNPLFTDAEEDVLVAENTIYHDAEHQSYVVLPIMTGGNDVAAPTTTDDYDNSWRNTDFSINLAATDDFAGVAETYYKINDGPTRNVRVHGQPIITEEAANNTMEYWSVDRTEKEEKPHNILANIKLDKTTPTIGTPICLPDGDILPNQTVKISVNATDATSQVKNVTLHFNINNTTIWEEPIPMNYNSTTGLYEATIPGQPVGTWIEYQVIAFDNAENEANDNAGQCYAYQVIPEFPSFIILPLLMATTLLALIMRSTACIHR